MTDLRLIVDEVAFAVRAVILCERDGQVLVEGGAYPFYNLPGGAAHLWETLEQAAAREWREETGLDAGRLHPVGLVENFFELGGRRCHELGFYYRTDATQTLPTDALPVLDNAANALTWVKPAASSKPIYPTPALSLLNVPAGEFRHVIHREGETAPGRDVRLDIGDTNLQVRVHLICVQEGHLLTNTEPGSGFWFLPGGSVTLNENSVSAAFCEFQEETGVQATSAQLVGVTDGFDHGRRRQQLGLCYRMEPARPLPMTPRPVQDQGRLQLEWVPLTELGAFGVQPPNLPRLLTLSAGQVDRAVLHWNRA